MSGRERWLVIRISLNWLEGQLGHENVNKILERLIGEWASGRAFIEIWEGDDGIPSGVRPADELLILDLLRSIIRRGLTEDEDRRGGVAMARRRIERREYGRLLSAVCDAQTEIKRTLAKLELTEGDRRRAQEMLSHLTEFKCWLRTRFAEQYVEQERVKR